MSVLSDNTYYSALFAALVKIACFTKNMMHRAVIMADAAQKDDSSGTGFNNTTLNVYGIKG